MEITSKNNSFIKELIKEKAKNRFLLFLDTPNLVKEGLESTLKLKHLFIEQGKTFDFVSAVDKDKVIFVSEYILKSLSDVKSPAGIVAVFEIEKQVFKMPTSNFLVLDNVQEPGNVGTLLRTAQATNFNQVYLLDSASISNPKTVRASSGAIFKLEIFELSKQEFLKKIKNKTLYLAVLNGNNVFDEGFKEDVVGLVLGNEGNGISKDFLNMQEAKHITLPMQNGLESLNVAISGSVIMYQISNKK